MVEPPPEAAPALEAAPAVPPALEAALEVAPAAAPAAAAAPTPTPTLIPTPTRTPDEAMPADLARAPEPSEAPMPAPFADLTPDAPAPDGRGASGASPAAAAAPTPAPEAASASAPKKFFTLRAPTLAEAARTKESESRVCVLFCVVSRREVSARAPAQQRPPGRLPPSALESASGSGSIVPYRTCIPHAPAAGAGRPAQHSRTDCLRTPQDRAAATATREPPATP